MPPRSALLSRQCHGLSRRSRLLPPREARRRPRRLVTQARVQPALLEIFAAVSEGRLSPLDAAQTVEETLCTPSAPPESALPRVVNGLGKRPEWTARRIEELLSQQGRVLVTGVDPSDYAAIRKLVPGVVYHAGAKTLTMGREEAAMKLPGSVGILADTAVTSQTLEELQILMEFMGCYVFPVQALTLTDLPDLLQQLQRVAQASAVVVVYREERALPEVISGWIDAPVISVSVEDHLAARDVPNGCLNASHSLSAALSVAKILHTAERLTHPKGGPYEDRVIPTASLDEQIQDALEILDGTDTSSTLQRINNVVTSDVTSVECSTDASRI